MNTEKKALKGKTFHEIKVKSNITKYKKKFFTRESHEIFIFKNLLWVH